NPRVLDALASRLDVAPAAARRARALLGAAAPLDAIDERVLAAIRARAPHLSARRFGKSLGVGAPWLAGWGLDGLRRTVWLPGGREIDLQARAQFWRLLCAVAESGGEASKERLATVVWETRDYHPLRDDKRMQVAVRKLRLLLEDNPSAPSRFVTTRDGYAFGDAEPCCAFVSAAGFPAATCARRSSW
ncbi:MAG TPA: helix-turn-helix domain-containing protein, partial [Polyangiaceae bacterium]